MGWGGHGDGCGGFPGADNNTLRQKLEKAIQEKITRYPKAKHYGLWATEGGVEVKNY